MKTIVRLNASSLVLSKCKLAWHRTIIEGYKEPTVGASLIYGVAVHKYIDIMFKSNGRMDLARAAALKAFRVPKYNNSSSKYIEDEQHLMATCYNVWEDLILKDNSFEIIQLNSNCWKCDGAGILYNDACLDSKVCPECEDHKQLMQPATEVTFEIPYFEDDTIIVYLCGTIDKIGKFKNGCYAIGDYKTTSSWKKDEYLEKYEMAAQLKFYVLSLKLMAQKYPESILGKIGATTVGAFIDAIYLKPSPSDISYSRSDVFQFKQETMDAFQHLLNRSIISLSSAIKDGSYKLKEGILNGACININEYGKCPFWNVCKAQDDNISEILLGRDFIKKTYDPLHHNA